MQKYGLFPIPPNFFANIFSRKIWPPCNFWILFLCLQEVKARIYFFLLLSADCKFAQFILHWQGIFPLFSLFCCRAWFLLLIIEEKRGEKRMDEDGRGLKEEGRGGRRARLALRLGRRARGGTDG